jgi:hypothetical protein
MPAMRRSFSMLVTAVAMCAIALSACADVAGAVRKPTHHLHVVNGSYDSVTALAIAPAQGGTFQDIELQTPVQGGLDSTTVDVPAGDCLRDVRVTFLHGAHRVYPGLDLCRNDSLRLTPGAATSTPSGTLADRR